MKQGCFVDFEIRTVQTVVFFVFEAAAQPEEAAGTAEQAAPGECGDQNHDRPGEEDAQDQEQAGGHVAPGSVSGAAEHSRRPPRR